MSPALKTALVPLALAGAFVLWNSFYTLSMTEQVIITQFGKIQGTTITEPGLHLKTPFVDTVNRFDKRTLEWDGPPMPMSTKDKQYLEIDTFARWRITDPLRFLAGVRDERTALSRLDVIIGSSTRNAIANQDLIEIIRTEKERKVNPSALPAGAEAAPLQPIRVGRLALEESILAQVQATVKDPKNDFGIEVIDVRFKRLNYNPSVLQKIYERMISERIQIASKFRSEGEGEAAKIQGQRELELNRITSEAYRKVQEIRGTAEAKASAIYAEAFNSSAQASEFYTFLKTLETYGKTASEDTTVVFSTGSDLFRLMKTVTPALPTPPAPATTPPAAGTNPAPASAPAPIPAPVSTPAPAPVPAGT